MREGPVNKPSRPRLSVSLSDVTTERCPHIQEVMEVLEVEEVTISAGFDSSDDIWLTCSVCPEGG